MDDGVVGRDEQRAAPTAFLDELRAGPCALVLEGEPGADKLGLWARSNLARHIAHVEAS